MRSRPHEIKIRLNDKELDRLNKMVARTHFDRETFLRLMLDRMGLSVRNGWLDEQGRVFIYYTVNSVREDLCCGKEKACKLLADLERADLIERRRQGLTKPSITYVKRFRQRSENPTSGGRNGEPTEVGKAEPNKTEQKETE